MWVRGRRLRSVALALLSAALVSALSISLYLYRDGHNPGLDRQTDLLLHDTALIALHERLSLVAPGVDTVSDQNPQLRLIAIDELSLRDAQRDALGQYRVSRDTYARLIRRLRAGGAKVVAFDLQFAAAASSAAQDDHFAAALRAMPAVLSYSLSGDEPGPIAASLASAAETGFVPVHNENGAMASQLLSTDERKSFATVAVERFTGEHFEEIDAWHARLGKHVIPLGGNGELLLLPFETEATTAIEQSTGAPAQWLNFAPSIELSDAMRLTPGELHDLFNGTLVVIGPTAHGIADFVDTPKGRLPVVFSTLRYIDQLMQHTFITRAPLAFDLACIIAGIVIVSIAGLSLSPGALAALSVALLLGYSTFSLAVLAYGLYWLDIIHVDFGIVVATLMVGLMRSAMEGAARRRVTEIFEKHTSPQLVHDFLDENPDDEAAMFTGKRVTVTVFYSDIRGFTALAEELPPEQIYRALNEYFEEMCAIIFKHGGYVDKFMGDALMAIFSAPTQTPHDPVNAVLAALEQQARLTELNLRWAAEGQPTFHVGMGINTGSVVMGHLGGRDRMTYTVIGDAVNVASRLQDVAKGGQIVIGEATERSVRGNFFSRELKRVVAKGKAHPLRVFEILGQRFDVPELPRVHSLTYESSSRTLPQPPLPEDR
jgi:class 3 adenylate cyclase/CHASE2 domain-containing sensor protein